MKRLAKWVGVVLGVVALIVVAGIVWVQLTWSVDHPDTPFPPITASDDPEVIARGAYLVHAVAHCSTCHQPADQVAGRLLDTGAPLAGGYVIEAGPFGTFTAANLTPAVTGIGTMTDGELARAIRYGIGRDGKLSPMMRFAVGPMADEDVQAIISYLRVQEPVDAERDGPVFGFVAKALSSRFSARMEEAPEYVPPGDVSVARGRYLASGPAFCQGCHSPHDPLSGFQLSGPAFSGAAEAEPDQDNPRYEIMAPNLTPDPGTGHIAEWSEEAFVARFRSGRVVHGSPMPWEAYAHLTEEDVRSIYLFLQTLEPVERATGPVYREKGSFRP
jgi:mono/diheme cytochrome c family protein